LYKSKIKTHQLFFISNKICRDLYYGNLRKNKFKSLNFSKFIIFKELRQIRKLLKESKKVASRRKFYRREKTKLKFKRFFIILKGVRKGGLYSFLRTAKKSTIFKKKILRYFSGYVERRMISFTKNRIKKVRRK
jgi:hypothetical protein